MNTIITICTVLSMYMTSLENVNSEYFYNADIENGIVTTMYVYENSTTGLTPKLSYDFKYDAEGRLIEKTTNRWDKWSQQYKPTSRLEMTYTDNGYEVAHSVWNKKGWKPTEKVFYQVENDQVLSVNYLQPNHQGEFNSVELLNVIDPMAGRLLAETK